MRFGQKMMQGADIKDLMGSMANMRNGSQMAMMQMFGSKPGAADAFAEMQKQMAKITGTRLVEITRMGGSGTGIDTQQGAAGNGTATNGNQGSNDGSSNTSTTNLSSPSSIVGGALAGMWHKKKAQSDNSQTTPPPAGTAPGQPQDVALMEMTVQTHGFSTDPVPPSVFQIPAGFKQVESPMEQMMNKK
jgi:hypothetical protein